MIVILVHMGIRFLERLSQKTKLRVSMRNLDGIHTTLVLNVWNGLAPPVWQVRLNNETYS